MIYALIALIACVLTFSALYPFIRAGSDKRIILLAGVGMIGLSTGLYAIAGAPELLPLIQDMEEKKTKATANIQSYLGKLRESPDNPVLWASLAQEYASYNDFLSAVEAMKKAVVSSGGRPEFIESLCVYLVSANSGTVTDETRKSLDMLLTLEPANEAAAFFIGLHEKQKDNKDKAREIWEGLQKRLSPSSPFYEKVAGQLKAL